MEELDRGRRMARRRWARVSFFVLVAESMGLWGALMFSEARAGIAAAFLAAWPVLIGAQGTLAMIVVAYLGVSVAERIWSQ